MQNPFRKTDKAKRVPINRKSKDYLSNSTLGVYNKTTTKYALYSNTLAKLKSIQELS